MATFRIGRLGYALTAWPSLIGALIISGLIQAGATESLLIAFLGLLLVGVTFVATAARLRDLGRPGWWALALMIPVLGVLGAVALAFLPGKAEEIRLEPPRA